MSKYEQYVTQREEVAYFMRRLYIQGLTTCSGGNLSLRVDADTILITPSALDKGELRADQIAMFTLSGENCTPNFKSSIETGMHLAVMRARPDINAIVHAHPVTATSFTATKREINCHLTSEAYAVLGTPKWAPYHIMGSEALAETVANCLKNTDVGLMQNHGIICVGKTMLNAFDKLEVLEAAAKMTWITSMLDAVSPLSKEQIDHIEREYRQ